MREARPGSRPYRFRHYVVNHYHACRTCEDREGSLAHRVVHQTNEIVRRGRPRQPCGSGEPGPSHVLLAIARGQHAVERVEQVTRISWVDVKTAFAEQFWQWTLRGGNHRTSDTDARRRR